MQKSKLPKFEIGQTIPAGEYLAIQRHGEIDEICLTTSEVVRNSRREFVGNLVSLAKINNDPVNPEYRGKWSFYAGGYLRPVTADELWGLQVHLEKRLDEVKRKLAEIVQKS